MYIMVFGGGCAVATDFGWDKVPFSCETEYIRVFKKPKVLNKSQFRIINAHLIYSIYVDNNNSIVTLNNYCVNIEHTYRY